MRRGVRPIARCGLCLLGFALLVCSLGAEPAHSPVGEWRQIDDQTGKAQSIIEIYREDGVLKGKIVEVLGEGEASEPRVCDACEGELEGHPYRCFPLIRGMKKQGEQWTGGYIVDPSSGKHYQARLSLSDGGRKLNVRGFIGIPLLGRTQVWERVEAP